MIYTLPTKKPVKNFLFYRNAADKNLYDFSKEWELPTEQGLLKATELFHADFLDAHIFERLSELHVFMEQSLRVRHSRASFLTKKTVEQDLALCSEYKNALSKIKDSL